MGNIYAEPVCRVLPCTPAARAPHITRDSGVMKYPLMMDPYMKKRDQSYLSNPSIPGPRV